MPTAILPPAVRNGPDRRILAAIALSGVGMALWQRSLPLCFSQWIDGLPPGHLPNGRVLVALDRIRPALCSLCDAVSMPPHRMRAWLVDDVESLARGYAQLQGLTAVDIRLEAVDGDACWRFHRDHVALRLLTTYRGPGTEWVAPDAAEAALAAQQGFAGPIQRIARGTVAVMKGSQHDAGAGILHRSPPVDGLGVTRLLLAVNAPSDASPEQMD